MGSLRCLFLFPGPSFLPIPPPHRCTPRGGWPGQHLLQVFLLEAFEILGPGAFSLYNTVSIRATFVFGLL